MAEHLYFDLPYNYSSRDYQKQFFSAMNAGKKRAVLVWHRRAGKEKSCWNYLISQALLKVGTYYYIFPDAKMARRIVWDGIDKTGFRMLHHIPENLLHGINNTEMKIVLKGRKKEGSGGEDARGSVILLLGSHDVDSLRGPNPIGCVFSEYAEQSPLAWQVISPILRENGGWAVFNFTPKGQNHAKELFDMAKLNKDWFAEVLTVEQTGAISKEEIDKERTESMMSEDMIQQEYYCSFTLGVEGSYYARNLQELRDRNRIGRVPWSPHTRVYTSWDIGYGDSTSIIFYQIIGKEIHIIDYYENHGEGLPHYANIISSKPYLYAAHYAPHDIESHSFSSGMSAREVGMDLGIRFVTLPTLKLRLEDGIEAARGLFPRLWIDQDNCKFFIRCLENYRKEYDERKACYRIRPLHDWTSHGADAFRYMAIAIKLYVDNEGDIITDKDADRLYNFYNPRFD